MKVWDNVRIIDKLQLYRTYEYMAKEMWLKNFKKWKPIDSFIWYKIKSIKYHDLDNIPIYWITNWENDFIIWEEWIKLVKSKHKKSAKFIMLDTLIKKWTKTESLHFLPITELKEALKGRSKKIVYQTIYDLRHKFNVDIRIQEQYIVLNHLSLSNVRIDYKKWMVFKNTLEEKIKQPKFKVWDIVYNKIIWDITRITIIQKFSFWYRYYTDGLKTSYDDNEAENLELYIPKLHDKDNRLNEYDKKLYTPTLLDKIITFLNTKIW